jgi:hypothetical protein
MGGGVHVRVDSLQELHTALPNLLGITFPLSDVRAFEHEHTVRISLVLQGFRLIQGQGQSQGQDQGQGQGQGEGQGREQRFGQIEEAIETVGHALLQQKQQGQPDSKPGVGGSESALFEFARHLVELSSQQQQRREEEQPFPAATTAATASAV